MIEIKNNIEKILDDNKAQSITSINLKNKSYIADYIIIASGTSSRHLQALSEILVNELKKKGIEKYYKFIWKCLTNNILQKRNKKLYLYVYLYKFFYNTENRNLSKNKIKDNKGNY